MLNNNFTNKPYKLVSRKHQPEDTVVEIPVWNKESSKKIGGGYFAVIGGLCSVESQDQLVSIAKDIVASGASFLRGGAFKARTSPYDFRGLGPDGLELLKIAREETGLPFSHTFTQGKNPSACNC